MACSGLPGSLVAEPKDFGVKKCTPWGARSPGMHTHPHPPGLITAAWCLSERIVLVSVCLYKWSSNLNLIFIPKLTILHSDHQVIVIIDLVLWFWLFLSCPCKFWNNIWLLSEMFCHVFMSLTYQLVNSFEKERLLYS